MTGWQVVEARCVAGGAHPLDDRFGVRDGFAWVIDGATDLDHDVLFAGAEGNASWLAGQIDAAFARFAVHGMTGPELLRRAIAQVSLLAAHEGIDEIDDFPVAVGVIARLAGPDQVELTLIGDCIAALEESTDSGAEVRVVTDPSWPALPLTAAPASSPVREQLPDDVRLQQMVAARRRYNSSEGRWVIRREPEAAEHAFVTTSTSFPNGRVLLMSDGAERLLHKAGYTFPQLFDAAFDDPDGLIAELRAFEDEQPEERWHIPHDDVTLLALRLPVR